MADHAGFADDFEEFRRQGEIGLVPALRITPARPEIGTSIDVQVSGLAHGRLRCGDGRSWVVQEGSRCRLPVFGPLQLLLLNELGQIESQALVEPWIERPVLRRWPLPAALAWHPSVWSVPLPQADGVRALRLTWRDGEDRPWQPLPADGQLPLAPARARLTLRAELRSRHAAYTPDAALTVERSVQIVAPAPMLLTAPDAGAPVCHSTRRLEFTARFARGLRLVIGGQTVTEVVGDGNHPLRLVHQWLPRVCGALRMMLTAVDLEGRTVALLDTELIVRPRRVQVQMQPCADEPDTVSVQIAGAQACVLSIPLSGETVADLPGRFYLTLQASGGADVLLDLQDDAGAWQRHALRLDPQPIAWQELPSWAPLPDPPW